MLRIRCTSRHLCWLLLATLLLLAACRREGQTLDDIPTTIPSLDNLATSEFMTANAPPEGFPATVAFSLVDTNLTRVPNWRAEVFMSFNGVYAGTPRPAIAQTQAMIWYNELGPERRVVVQRDGVLFGQEAPNGDAPNSEAAPIAIEGVRLADDTFLVRDNVCVGQVEGAAVVADLRAGELIGGVAQATTSGINATINGERVWRYDFQTENLNLPQLELRENSRITEMSGELWVAPEHNAVIRYYLRLNLENVIILLDPSETPLPVSGEMVIRYDIYDIGINPNITQPFGC